MGFVEEVGETFWLLVQTLMRAVRRPFDGGELLRQMNRVGVASVPVVGFTALFVGMVIGLQTYQGFVRFRAGSFTGGIVALSLFREIAPVFTALMVTGRIGSAFAAELAAMRSSEQIDALVAMGTDPVQYLFVPRILAGVLMLPVLEVLADGIGLVGGRVVAVGLLGANSVDYDVSTFRLLDLSDLRAGVVKAAIFGLLLTLIPCVHGFHAAAGAEGVGRATTRAVVASCLAIVAADFFASKLLF